VEKYAVSCKILKSNIHLFNLIGRDNTCAVRQHEKVHHKGTKIKRFGRDNTCVVRQHEKNTTKAQKSNDLVGATPVLSANMKKTPQRNLRKS
jgi:hypothetical protein